VIGLQLSFILFLSSLIEANHIQSYTFIASMEKATLSSLVINPFYLCVLSGGMVYILAPVKWHMYCHQDVNRC